MAECIPAPIPLIIITDPGQDLDDEMALVMLSALWRAGLTDPRCVVSNLHPSADRAALARGTLDVLGLQNVPVGEGTDGGDTTGSPVDLPGYAPSGHPLPAGSELLQQTLESSEDASLTVLLISSIKDAAECLRSHEQLFARKVCRVVIMGGTLPQRDPGNKLEPDTAHNNSFDSAASAFFYERIQQLRIPMVVLTRHAAYSCPVPRAVFEELAASGSEIGRHLQSRQQQSIEQLWRRAAGEERLGLPVRCDKHWFSNTFCGGSVQVETRSEHDSIWDLVERFQMYDTFALLACIPCLQSALFSPVGYTVLGVEHLVIGVSPEEPGMNQDQRVVAAKVLSAGYLAGGSQEQSQLQLQALNTLLEFCSL
eukprot:TRINITY_DN11957_c0_g1_i1.p1 TRINITY_DN11957_c0_g1~~TRINITY_DN11957_c0_g1_i1.p1  ORF type:complete len:368 (+),score=59.76 TRINITY_DN11957_c0_g1_i1:166-1269(+)